jgi:arylsulfatase A-like enzyme
MDEQVGRVMAALKKAALADKTVVVYTSDHGDGNAAHHWNQKMVLYEEAVRVPLIVSWPGHTASGKVEDTHVASTGLDLLPTFADLAGVKVPPELPGRNLRPLIEGDPPSQSAGARDFLGVSEVNYKDLMPGEPLVHGLLLRSAGFTYIIYLSRENPEQLFDIHADPGQTRNLVTDGDYQAVLKANRQMLREWVEQTQSPFPLASMP